MAGGGVFRWGKKHETYNKALVVDRGDVDGTFNEPI